MPETERTWSLRGEPVPLPAEALRRYRGMVEAFRRRQLNTGEADGRKLCTELTLTLSLTLTPSSSRTRARTRLSLAPPNPNPTPTYSYPYSGR